MDLLDPQQIIEYLDQIAESLTEYDECYAALEMIYAVKDEIVDALDIELDE